MFSPHPTNLAFQLINPMAQKCLRLLAHLPENQFVGSRLRMGTTRALSVGGSLCPIVAAGERPTFDIKPPLVAPPLIFPRGDLLKSFPQGDTSVRQRGLASVFPLSLVSCEGLSSLTCSLASYTAGNSVPPCGLRLRPSQ